jgi:TonB family protein
MTVRRLFQATLLLSLLLHFSLSLYIYVVDSIPAPKNETIEITLHDPAMNADDPKLKQIVQQNPEALNDEKDPNAKFLSEHNQRVVEQTRAQTHGDFKNAQVKDMLETKKANKEKKSKMKQLIAADQKTASGLPVLEALKPNFDWDRMDKIGGSKRETASKTDDYLKEVKEGAQTMLSTREFLYYSYYNRIRGQLKQYWEPRIKDKVKKIFAAGRSIASDEDRITKVLIVLNTAGTLVKVQVVGESGIRDLDDAAVEAFRQAAPFPNPPKGIVDGDGLIKIRWDFILEA